MNETPERVSVALVGKDCRTDALTEGCAASSRVGEVIGVSELSPPGMMDRCTRFMGHVSLTDLDPLIDLLREAAPDLLIVGPEEPLAAGLVDRVEDDLHIPCFGPRQELARIEFSKSWARGLVQRRNIAGNPEFRIFTSTADLELYLRKLGEYVIKPDGLTGGKGVKVSGEHLPSIEDAIEYTESLIQHDGVALVEERLEGEEFSLQTITDGEAIVHCPLVQDHKRADEMDKGPNTGGMGSYSCADHSLPFLTTEDVRVAQSINESVIHAVQAETGLPYRGVLYGGFMATASGIKLIEYNARFGDPEAMNVLALLSNDLLDVCWATATGSLSKLRVSFRPQATVCKYIVPAGYPGGKGEGDAIQIDESFFQATDPNVKMFWAAVNRVDGVVRMTGSRALAVVGVGRDLERAELNAEEATRHITGPVHHRRDIGTEALIAKRVEHMRTLRGIGVPHARERKAPQP